MKKVIKGIFILTILGFVFLYYSYRNGYYIRRNEETNILNEEKIKEYEEDLKNGVDVSKKNYIVVRDSYDNSYSPFLFKISNKIEKGIDKVIKFFFKKISNTINE